MRTCLLLAALALLTVPAVAAEEAPAPRPSINFRPKPPVPLPPEELESAIRRGVEYLLADQNKDGSWGTPSLKGGVPIWAGIGSHHAYGVATTALCVSGLIEVGGDDPAALKAIERGEESLLKELPKVRRDDPILIYNVWAHAYGIQALVRMHRRLPNDKDRQKKIEEQIRTQYEKLTRYESAEGGWGYYDFDAGTQRPAASSTSFVNAAILVAMHEAKEIGVPPPEKVLKRAVKMTQFQRLPDNSFLYGTYLWSRPTMSINAPGGSLGRSQACNLALRLWGDEKVTDAVIKEWLDRLVTKNGWLSVARKKPIPHESFFLVAGYFYYFGHYYAAESIELLPTQDRPFYQDHLARIILELQEADGSWFDYPFYNYHKQYGTGYVLQILAACRKAEKK
jgi:hypothetical protein